MDYSNDADLLTHALEQTARRAAQALKRGQCSHGWIKTENYSRIVCLDCGQVFKSSAEHEQTRADVLDL